MRSRAKSREVVCGCGKFQWKLVDVERDLLLEAKEPRMLGEYRVVLALV